MFGGSSRAKCARCGIFKRIHKIPIPRVYAYGQAQLLHNSSAKHAFMILDHIKGQQLVERQLSTSSEEHRRRFYSELVDIFAQLRSLEFSAAGSLMPNPADESEPIVGDFMDIAINELQRESGCKKRTQPFTSAEAFIDYQYSILTDSTPSQPAVVKRPVHPIPYDLRCSNIIVEDHLHIMGIVDWEFTGAVPLQFFTPPLWITGQARAGIFFPWHDAIFQSFGAVLQAMSITTEACAQLVQEWNWNNQQNLVFPVVQILLEPDTLLRVYQSHLCDTSSRTYQTI
ncbi:hypothetical protein QQX98_012118 [Neonectria punicea]|uniref:Aminoglycoside phosphotransferase domain-containing protein n=1 Tax=Neonectria punicea TaxID=979145 RepID=A0ABR1GK74_9HYPO